MPSVVAELTIAAPPAVVWGVLTDTVRYGEWNPRLLRIDGALVAGGVVTLHYRKDSLLPSRFVVDVDACEPERELRWSGPRNPARALFRASHSFRLAPVAGGTSLVHGELFEGVLAPLVWRRLEPLVSENHADVNAALRARAESVTRKE